MKVPASTCKIMGVLNVTPDSFSDGGALQTPAQVHAAAAAMIADGAHYLDIGAESTRPGATPIDAHEEQRRLLPMLNALPVTPGVILSVDTTKADTARAALRTGVVGMINDIRGLQGDPAMADVAAEYGAGVCIMHYRAHDFSGADPTLDIIDDILQFWTRSLQIARAAGIPDDTLLFDPGIGFGKTDAQMQAIFLRFVELRAFGRPILVGASRKSFLGRIIQQADPTQRDAATLAAHLLTVLQGASVLRVHDVRAHADMLRVVGYLHKSTHALVAG